jgi:hypothetical protein
MSDPQPAKESTVPLITVGFGVLLAALGLWGYFGAESAHRSITALIPTFVGGPLILLGLLALNEKWLKHAMHLAAMLGVLGFLAAGGRLVVSLIDKGSLTAVLDSPAGPSVVSMTVLCAVFVGLCVNSFIQARRRRRAREALGNP